ncbi:DNA-directed RNA polymerase III subunit RPC7-like [Anastrepha obliqua]|uniref:DNA-directed RNA polymerase III subunit RPC7-like n=1 Tax=Anastrepha obliqua TaxID=95512 RepID=UPI0024095BD0|nr:DNA-directed RNA polymerase III subunit RPC7-like [Anastrepha obliqua]XP_054735656.1 DNA-directed RNA polymerase III subunit RPC7-like [Anastrepha obliqua]
MAGRGRGKTGSLTQEQLQTLGCIGKDIPQVQTAPPPTFPPLMTKPVKLETTAAQNYQILWKEAYLNHMRDSPYFLTPKIANINRNLQSYSDEWASAVESAKRKTKADFVWQMMPAELHSTQKKRRITGSDKIVAKKSKNVDDRLKVLEEKERNEDNKDVAKASTDSEQEDEEEEEAPADEEMDDENDYGNSYFDNGEAYNEEDDNLDDGPVY